MKYNFVSLTQLYHSRYDLENTVLEELVSNSETASLPPEAMFAVKAHCIQVIWFIQHMEIRNAFDFPQFIACAQEK